MPVHWHPHFQLNKGFSFPFKKTDKNLKDTPTGNKHLFIYWHLSVSGNVEISPDFLLKRHAVCIPWIFSSAGTKAASLLFWEATDCLCFQANGTVTVSVALLCSAAFLHEEPAFIRALPYESFPEGQERNKSLKKKWVLLRARTESCSLWRHA